ncbi:protein VARIATION IN COMPOUND TRIGGERED ROOT growth response-like [Prosopis cineraria]|uniref:protein VARIATION IN COMPOUND TRIGGERED ROOT growth response-like n=1 Tax=Prosopis cineraria TaxID=364024 RepID=UPI00240EAFEA|nr:protein VARIATION IN COMPOUND TRIGGERED ROOT growth response-like [Prosopis cineraria]
MALEAHGIDHPSSSFSSARRWKYHVFLSFRGEDTCRSFTNHLYCALQRNGIIAFNDDEELERGEVIKPSLLRAIEESLSAIVVLSPNYASSTWCLDELSKILHSKKESGLYVFPIFYGVDPSDVEHQRGSFAEAFKKHEEIFTRDEMKVQNWRDALKEVANLSGWHADNCGLSLALKVLGSFLCGRTIEKWKDALAKLKKVPPNNILKILKVSFDELDHREKTIFLDIACFFNGMAKGPLIQILEILDEDLHPTIGIDVLIDKSLVINSEGYLWVPHILRDMGKYIVSQASPNDAGKHSRILSLKDANDVLEGNKGTGAIRGIPIIVDETFNALGNPDAFLRMINLKLLVISSCSHISHCQLNLSRGIKSLPNGLKLLAWDGYPLDSLPNQTKFHELLVLKMQHSKLKELWRGARKGVLNWLKLHQSLGQHKNLVIVNLKGCKKVRTLPRKFEMDRLKIFVLPGCSKIRKLPEFEKDMKCLSTLDLENNAISKLPESLGNLIGLVELNLTGCTNLVWPPNNVHKFIARKIIKISGWSNLSRMPEDLNENGTLEVLDVGRISSSSWSCVSLLRKSFGLQGPLSSTNFMVPISLSFLSQLNLGYCKLHDGSLPDDISMLSSLTHSILSGNNFIDLPSRLISNLSKLLFFDIVNCPTFRSLPQLPSNLSTILASGCPSMEHYMCSQKLWEFIESFQSQVINFSDGFIACYEEHKPVILFQEYGILTQDLQIPDFFKQYSRVLTIQGSEVPPWFHNQNYFCEKEISDPNVSFTASIPEYCHSSEWGGTATCLVLENDLASSHLDLEHPEIMFDYPSTLCYLCLLFLFGCKPTSNGIFGD